MLERPFPFFVSKKAGEIMIFGNFLAKKKSVLAYILLKIDIFVCFKTILLICFVISKKVYETD